MDWSHHIKDFPNFNSEMIRVKKALNQKGFAIESDSLLMYSMQYESAFDDVCDWLSSHGYSRKVCKTGGFWAGSAVYGIYDERIISYEQMRKELEMEAERQLEMQGYK